MAFSFNFSGDDIDTAVEADSTELQQDNPQQADSDGKNNSTTNGAMSSSATTTLNIPVRQHDLKEWVGRLFTSVILFISLLVFALYRTKVHELPHNKFHKSTVNIN